MSTLEFPLLRAPLESLSQITRNTQKIIAKEMTTCTSGVNHFTNAVKVGTTKDNTVAMSTALTTLIGNVQQLKRKLEEASTQSTKHARRCSSRLTYLHELDDTEHTYHEHHRHYQKHQSQQSQQQSQQWISIAQQIVAMQNATGMGAIPMGMNITTSPNVTPIAMPVSPTFSSSSFLSPSLSPTLSPTMSSPIPSLSLSPPLSHLPSEQTYLQHMDTRKHMHHKRLHKIFIDYLGRSGYLSSAAMLTEQTQLHDLVDLDLFLSARRVLDGLAKKDVTRGLAWCGENRSRLVKINSTLEFDLRIQDFLHLIRTCSTIDAITYAQKHLSPHATTSIQHMNKIGEVMNALVYRDVILNDDGDGNEAWKKYKPLFDDSRWITLANAFRADHLTLAGLPRTSALEMMLSSGISALKTPWCNDTSASHDSGDCPVCCAPLAALARTLPMSQRTHSCLVCRLSGEVMDEHNPPLVLPNGSIYSKQALTRQAIASGGHVTCPRTGQSFPLAQCRQAYVL